VKLSAVIACYRDAPAVPIMYERLVRAFTEVGADYEIIFVNDGSPDNAREVLAELAQRDPGVVVINHARAFGSQSAFTSGMRIATGDAVVLLDGDLQDPPEMIPQFVARWREGYDVVYGERVKREASLVMRHAYRAFYRVFKRLAYVSVPLDAGDFSLIDRRVVDAINALPETHRFVRGLRAWVGYKQLGVPYVRPERMFGRTTNSFRKNLGWARRAIVSFSYAPLDAITGIALSVVAFASVGLIVEVGLRILDPHLAPKGFTTVISVVLFIGGIQLLCLAIIGTYLAHMYEEVKGRPPYVVESVMNAPAGAEFPDRVVVSAPGRDNDARRHDGAGSDHGADDHGADQEWMTAVGGKSRAGLGSSETT
jgi:dolichol-phosphate mannosyltransferase